MTKVANFDDALGLPKVFTYRRADQQPLLEYSVSTVTNFMGWTFPTEFHLAQYQPAATNAWRLAMTATGRLMQIGSGKDLDHDD